MIVLFFLSGLARAQVSVSTFHNDNARTGQNTQETILTPSNVNSLQFGKLFSLPVDGYVYAQPLYLAGVTIGGVSRNVVYVATEHDSVYAIDADSGTIYAQVSLIAPGASTINTTADLPGCNDLIPEIGITGTPVIDTTTGTLYVVAKSKNADGSFVQYLHALDVATLIEKLGGPVQIVASSPGSATDGNGTSVSFNSKLEFQRPALLLENSHVVIGWSSHCDAIPWHGWVMSYSASNLAQEGVFNVTSSGSGGGVWMAGGGLAADSSGNIYFPTGNGTWNGTTDFGNSIVKLGPPSAGGFPVLDYFTPWNQSALYSGNSDVASGGLVLLPAVASGQQLLAQAGKSGVIELLDQNNLGQYCVNQPPGCSGSNPNAVQELAAGGGVSGSPAYWNGNLYWGPNSNPLKAYAFNAAGNPGKISTAPTSQSAQSFAYAAPTPAVSSNGTTNGILWALDGSGYNSTCGDGTTHCLGLYAYDATNLSNMLYNSMQSANDSPGTTVKFAAPVIANGKVYIGTQSGLAVYGLLSHAPTAATPAFNPPAGSYANGQTVSLSDGTPGAAIYYTTDGSTPTASSTKYTTPLSVSVTTTIKAIAIAAGYSNSAVASATFTIAAAGTTPVSVSLSGVANVNGIVSAGTPPPNGGLDGSSYAYAANLLGTTINWPGANASFTLGAAGTLDAVTSKTIPLPAGKYLLLDMLATGVNGNQSSQTFIVTYSDGTTSTFVQGLSDWGSPGFPGESVVVSMGSRVAPNGSAGPGTWNLYGYSFALDGTKTVSSLTLPNNRHVVVLALDLIPAGSSSPTAATPTFSPPAGTYSSTQTVTLSDSTPGALIYYSTNGVAPTTSSTQYTAPLSISASTTIQAIAVASGYTNSAVASAAYTIGSSTAPVSVNMTGAYNVNGIVNNGSAPPSGGLDGGGYAYSANLLGTSLTWAGSTFTLGSAGTPNAITSKTIALPGGSYASLNLLATAVNGNQANQTFIVTYSDGTTSSFTRSLSDWFHPQGYAGESTAATMAYRVTPNGTTGTGPCYLYGYSLALNSAKLVASITLPANINVVALAVNLIPAGSGSQNVNNVYGIVSNGSPPPSGGLDGSGYAYSGTLLGTSLTWAGSSFTLGAAGTLNAVSNKTIALTAGNYATLNLLATAVNGSQPNQTFIVTYSDGTTSSFTQGVSDWFHPQGYAGESTASTMAYRVTPNGTTGTGPCYLYGYSFTLNSAKTVASLTLPANNNVVLLAVSGSASQSVNNVYGIVSNGSPPPSGGLDGSGYAYSANLLGTSLTWAGSSFTLGAAGTLNAVSNKTIPLPAGSYATLNLLATAVNGNQPNRTFIVTYSDGTTSSFTQSLSDWFHPQGYAGESGASTMAYRVTPSGTQGTGPCYLYGYTFALDSAKTVASLSLPNTPNVVVLGTALVH